MERFVIEEYTEDTGIWSLYQSVGWSSLYPPETLKHAFDASLCILVAYHREAPVGLIRAVGDGITVILIQDVLVHPCYQRKGIGTRLIAKLWQKFPGVSQQYVLTDDRAETVGFYRAVGFLPIEQLHQKALAKMRI